MRSSFVLKHWAQLSLESEKETEAKPNRGVKMKEVSVKLSYTRYYNPNKSRFFKLLLERCLSAAAVANQSGIHVHIGQKWAAQYKKDPDSIFQTSRPRILYEDHKSVILECIGENPFILLEAVMSKLKQNLQNLQN